VYAAPTLRRPNITPPQHYAAPSVAVTIEDRASPSFGEVTSSLNRNGDGSILYIGSVSVCVRRPTSYARAALTNVAVTWGFIACRFYSVCYCSKPSLCQWATFELLSAPFGSAGACQFSEAVSYYASHSNFQCAPQKQKAHCSQPSLCQCETFEPFFMHWECAGACIFSRRHLLAYSSITRFMTKPSVSACCHTHFQCAPATKGSV
jgi:hypothetical protein